MEGRRKGWRGEGREEEENGWRKGEGEGVLTEHSNADNVGGSQYITLCI